MIDYTIGKLTELMIKQTIEDKKRGKVAYIKKQDAYRDLIKLFKNIQYMEGNNEWFNKIGAIANNYWEIR